MREIDALLSAADAGELRISVVTVIDWYDGPLEGFARLSGDGRYWHFRLLAERRRTETIDDRVFVFARLTADGSDLVEAFQRQSPAGESVMIERVAAEVGPPLLLVNAPSFSDIRAVWEFAHGGNSSIHKVVKSV